MLRNKEINLWKVIAIRLCIVLLLLSLSRWLLYIFNINSFNNLSTNELIRLYIVGFRFDIYTLIIFNIPLIIFYTIPFKIKYNTIYKKIIDILFVITNSTAIALNLIDVIYYRYLDKRMSSELFTFLKGSDENQGSLVLNFISDFWFMFVIFFVFMFLIILITKRTKLKESHYFNNKTWYIRQSAGFIVIVALSILGIRGGFQLKPINLTTATDYTSPKNIPLVINTPFSICMSSTSSALEKIDFFEDDAIDTIYSPIHYNLNHNRFIKKETTNSNIVMIILESFGQEMIGYYNQGYDKSLTPFLDSLLNESLTFDGMANGRRSIEALPSIFCGLPSLMSTDYPSSRYAINRLDGFGTILKEKGYKTAFFHGGNNGTMSFNSTSKSSGFDDYYGRDEYDNDNDFDGTWGIYDNPFLQYTASTLNQYDEPFAAVIFTLSSHHPYSLPEDYIINDSDANTPFENTVRYVDDALRDFFNTVSNYDWFDNTIFVITADHVNPEHKFETYKNMRGSYRIPLAFYAPQIIESYNVDEIAQHIDLGVSILSILNINDTILSFGRNLFDSIGEPSFMSFSNNVYQYSDGKHFMQSDGDEIKRIFKNSDKNLSKNIYKNNADDWRTLDTEFKARLQQYNNRMINNQLYYTE